MLFLVACLITLGTTEQCYNKKSVSWGNRSENLGRVGTHVFFNYFFPGKKIILCILKGILPFKLHLII